MKWIESCNLFQMNGSKIYNVEMVAVKVTREVIARLDQHEPVVKMEGIFLVGLLFLIFIAVFFLIFKATNLGNLTSHQCPLSCTWRSFYLAWEMSVLMCHLNFKWGAGTIEPGQKKMVNTKRALLWILTVVREPEWYCPAWNPLGRRRLCRPRRLEKSWWAVVLNGRQVVPPNGW